uniref:NADH dehydrogenase subunit 6 n=1 Tax=Pachylophus rufescens TaxID=3127035 RepID=UPI0030FE447B
MMQLLYMISFSTSLIFTKMYHPLAMGLMLLIQTTLISMLTGLINKTFWFSYILFLIFMGGMLVLFIYVTSLASNEMFYFSTKQMLLSFIMIGMILMMMTFFKDYLFTNMNMNNFEMNSISKEMILQENSIMLNKLYNYPTNLITILLMNYLLITLIAIVKITKLFYGPLRLMN